MSCTASTAPKCQWRSIKAGYDALIEGWQTKMDFDSWFEVKCSVWKSRCYAARNQRLCFETYAIALTGSTGRPSVLLVVTHPPGT